MKSEEIGDDMKGVIQHTVLYGRSFASEGHEAEIVMPSIGQ